MTGCADVDVLEEHVSSAPDRPGQSVALYAKRAHRIRAVSSAVEHCLHTAGVAGSKPAPPTRKVFESKALREIARPFFMPDSGRYGNRRVQICCRLGRDCFRLVPVEETMRGQANSGAGREAGCGRTEPLTAVGVSPRRARGRLRAVLDQATPDRAAALRAGCRRRLSHRPGSTSPTSASVTGSGTVAPLTLMSKLPLRSPPVRSQNWPDAQP